jgi:hypothetical protein
VTRADLAYVFGVLCAAATGFCSPVWYLGFVPLAAGSVWASYDLLDAEAPSGNTSRTP